MFIDALYLSLPFNIHTYKLHHLQNKKKNGGANTLEAKVSVDLLAIGGRTKNKE